VLTGAGSFETAAITLRRIIRDIADRSNLILDPEISSYYAMAIVFNHVPVLIERSVFYDEHEMQREFEGLQHAIEMAFKEHSGEGEQIAGLAAKLKERFIANTGLQLVPLQIQENLSGIKNIEHIARNVLQHLLEQRLHIQENQSTQVLIIIAGLYVVLMTTMAFALKNYVSKREITLSLEREKLVNDLAAKNDELEKFAYAAAHDLKEPVRTLRCFATLLKNEAEEKLDSTSMGYIKVIESTAQRSEQMINDLLGYTQVNEEKLVITECHCRKEVASVLDDIHPLISKVNANIIIGDLPVIQTVPSMFRRVMLNLIDNAVKYRKKDTRLAINITAEIRDGVWQFCVKDNGIGIAKEHTESVFAPYRRLFPSLYQEGNGIGLTSSRRIVERLGGKIWITSDKSEGTEVWFTLPQTTTPAGS
jgi:signal transduction histidine kinase